MVAIAAAVAAFLITALTGKPLAAKLNKMGLGRTALVRKGEDLTPGRDEAPEFGGVLFLAGFLPAGILAAAALIVMGSTGAGFSAGKITAVLLGSVLMAAVGLTDDWRTAKRLPVMNPVLRCVLVWCVGLAFLMALTLSGSYSTIVLVPFSGTQADLGNGVWYLLLMLGAACGGNRMKAVSGEAASVSLAQCLSCAAVCAVFGADAGMGLSFAAAGSLLGMLLYCFPPEKMREGSGGRMMLGALPVFISILSGIPLFLIPAGIPFIFEGIYVMIRVVCQAAGHPLRDETLGEWMLSRGISGKAVSGIMTAASLLGGILSVTAAYLYI